MQIIKQQSNLISAQVPTTQGLRTVNLIDEDTIANWIIKDNPDLAPKLLKAGVRGYMHKLAGFEIKSTAIEQEAKQKLPSRIEAVETAEAIEKINSLLGKENPRLAQFLVDHAISDLMSLPKSLKPTEERLRGVVEIAAEMGMPVNLKNRSELGKFVRPLCEHLSKLEKRLVNGTLREVRCYPNYQEVRDAIEQFFKKEGFI